MLGLEEEWLLPVGGPYIPVPLLLSPQLRTASQNDYIWSELVWGKHRDDQNVFYLHGALPLQ